jgi:hypothetical protein
VAPQVDIEAQRLFEDIAEIANGRATTEEMRMVIDRFCAHYHSQLNDIPHTSPGVINLLLSALMESQRKLSEVASTRDDVRDRLTMKLEAAQLRRRTLEQVHRTEKETAWRNEEALRSHCNEISAQSRSKVELAEQRCQSLRKELDQQLLTNQLVLYENSQFISARRRTVAAHSSSESRFNGGQRIFKIAAAYVGCVLFLHAWFGNVEVPVTNVVESVFLSPPSDTSSFGSWEYFQLFG